MINLFNYKLCTKEETQRLIYEESKTLIHKILPIGVGVRWNESESSPVPKGWIKAGTDISDTSKYDERYNTLRALYGDVLPVEDNTIFLAYYFEEE